MDSIGHAIITTAVSDSPLAIVASGINLRYDQKGVMLLQQALPQDYAELVKGVKSHILTNRLMHDTPSFNEMRKEARVILAHNGIDEKLSHVAAEVAIDCLLLEEPEVKDFAMRNWDAFDWNAALNYLPQFSRQPERAERNIRYVRQRPYSFSLEGAAQWLSFVGYRLPRGKTAEHKTYLTAITQLADSLRKSGKYTELIRETQANLKERLS